MMKTITQKNTSIIENKTVAYLLALLSFVSIGFVLVQQTTFPHFNIFNNHPKNTGVAMSGKNAASPNAVTDVVSAALSFKATLTTTQQATLEKTYTTTLARKWSNLPCGSGCRNGIQFSTLNATQLAAALQVIQYALGNGTNNGYEEWNAIRVAEDYLGANGGGSGYNSGLRWIAFLNTPSATGAWMLQFGGHHYAANIAFNNGHVIGATPFFVALEPATFTYNGTSYAPMEDERTALRTMLASLSSTQLATAKLTTTFSDCLMSPGESNGNTNTMPATKQGIKCSTLTTDQKNLVLAAIQNYVSDLDAATAASIMASYTSQIDNTYLAFTGNATAGNASSFLVSNSNYARIDGPLVWIEFACQNGVVFPGQIHYHSVWRDHSSDYGVDLTGAAIDNNLAVGQFAAATKMKLYPNPATDMLNVSWAGDLDNATIYITDMTGKILLKKVGVSGLATAIDLSSLANGAYILKLVDGKNASSSKFLKR